MRRLDDLDAPAGPSIAVAGDHQPLAWPPGGLDRFGHARAGLARADHDQPPGGAIRQIGRKALHRIGHGDGAVKEAAQEGMRVLHGVFVSQSGVAAP